MKRFNIYGRMYKLVRTDELPPGAVGYCDPEKRVIAIHTSQEGNAFWETLVHELDHAAKFESGLVQTLDHTALEISAESISRVILDNFTLRPRPKTKR